MLRIWKIPMLFTITLCTVVELALAAKTHDRFGVYVRFIADVMSYAAPAITA